MPTTHANADRHRYPIKIIVSREEVARFNARWPGSVLDDNRHYWFEFDADGNLIDTDVPEHSDGLEASSMAEDCKEFHFDGEQAPWMT
jgi:hypothetical protein